MRGLSFRDIGVLNVTFKAEKALIEKLDAREDENVPVSVALVDAETVGLGTDGADLFGFAYVGYNDGTVGVQLRGFATDVVGAGALAAKDAVVLDGKGGVKKADTAKVSTKVVIGKTDCDGLVVYLG